MTKEEFVKAWKNKIDQFSEYMKRYDDIPTDMTYDDWEEQLLAYFDSMEIREEVDY